MDAVLSPAAATATADLTANLDLELLLLHVLDRQFGWTVLVHKEEALRHGPIIVVHESWSWIGPVWLSS